MKLRNNKGLSILEVLISIFLFSVVSVAMFKALDMSLLSSNVSNSLLAEADLKLAIHKVLSAGQCEKNLHPSKLHEVTSDSRTLESLTRYKLPGSTGVEIIKKGETFRDYLSIVKIELAGEATDAYREFKVYYARERSRHLRTRKGQLCNESDQSGCYVNKCNIEYEADYTNVNTCTILDCFSVGDKQSVKCYLVESQTGDIGRTLVGCGGASEIKAAGTVAFGYGAGSSTDQFAEGNTFIGYLSGFENASGYDNTFIGYQVGYKNIAGFRNIFIGYKAGFENRSGEKNTFIGYEAGFRNNSATNNVFIGSNAGYGNELGIRNVFIGSEAGRSNNEGWGNIFIGYEAGHRNQNENKRLNIGNLIYGKYTDGRDYNRYPSQQGINVSGKIKQCNSRGRDCKEVSTVEDSTIQDLKDKINKLCAVDPDVCN